jgi:hypothetical protein
MHNANERNGVADYGKEYIFKRLYDERDAHERDGGTLARTIYHSGATTPPLSSLDTQQTPLPTTPPYPLHPPQQPSTYTASQANNIVVHIIPTFSQSEAGQVCGPFVEGD